CRQRRAIIASAASRSARPLDSVVSTSTIRPLRFSIITWVMYASFASEPADLRDRRASGSVLDSCVSLLRRSPRKSTSSLRPPPPGRSSPPPSFGRQLLCDAQASISVPSTLKCSSLVSLPHSASILTLSKNTRPSPSLNSRSRLWLKVEWSHTASSIDRPTNQRYNRL